MWRLAWLGWISIRRTDRRLTVHRISLPRLRCIMLTRLRIALLRRIIRLTRGGIALTVSKLLCSEI